MKKSIFVLAILLFALIISCVYQKTHTIYAASNTDIVTSAKEEMPTAKNENTPSTEEILLTEKESLKQSSPLVVEKERVIQTKVSPNIETKTAVIRTETKYSTSSVQTKEVASTEIKELEGAEIVDYVMWALENRNIALANRDKVVLRIEELVKKILAERLKTIEKRDNRMLALEKQQQETLDARDIIYEKILQTNTIHTGE